MFYDTEKLFSFQVLLRSGSEHWIIEDSRRDLGVETERRRELGVEREKERREKKVEISLLRKER